MAPERRPLVVHADARPGSELREERAGLGGLDCELVATPGRRRGRAHRQPPRGGRRPRERRPDHATRPGEPAPLPRRRPLRDRRGQRGPGGGDGLRHRGGARAGLLHGGGVQPRHRAAPGAGPAAPPPPPRRHRRPLAPAAGLDARAPARPDAGHRRLRQHRAGGGAQGPRLRHAAAGARPVRRPEGGRGAGRDAGAAGEAAGGVRLRIAAHAAHPGDAAPHRRG